MRSQMLCSLATAGAVSSFATCHHTCMQWDEVATHSGCRLLRVRCQAVNHQNLAACHVHRTTGRPSTPTSRPQSRPTSLKNATNLRVSSCARAVHTFDDGIATQC